MAALCGGPLVPPGRVCRRAGGRMDGWVGGRAGDGRMADGRTGRWVGGWAVGRGRNNYEGLNIVFPVTSISVALRLVLLVTAASS